MAGGRHSTDGHSSCSPQLPDPRAVRPQSAVHTGYLSPNLGALPRGDTLRLRYQYLPKKPLYLPLSRGPTYWSFHSLSTRSAFW